MAASLPDPVSVPTLTRARRLPGWATLLTLLAEPRAPEAARAGFVGSATCGSCHAREYGDWRSNDNARAMAAATPVNVLNVFVPIGWAEELPYVLVTKRDYPARNVAAFIAAVETRPGFTYGAPGIGTIGHLAGALLELRAGIKMEHDAYRRGVELARDVADGSIGWGYRHRQ